MGKELVVWRVGWRGMRGDEHKMESFQTRRVGNSKAFKALHCAILLLLLHTPIYRCIEGKKK